MGRPFNDTVMEHFRHPRHAGALPPPRGVGSSRVPRSGAEIRVFVRVEGGRVVETGFLSEGCVPAIASASWLAERVRGLAVEQARAVGGEDVARGLGGLPAGRAGCPRAAVEALHRALDDALQRASGDAAGVPTRSPDPCEPGGARA